MTPIKDPMCNDVLRKPPGMTEEECRDLHIRRDDGAVWSFWIPNAEELLALNRGGSVALCVMGATHPPLSIFATHPTEPQEMRPADPSEYRNRMEVVNARLIALTKLLKTALSAWTKNHPDDKDRSKIADQFLDMLNANKADGSLVVTVPADEPAAITQTDLDRYRADAEGWKGEAERLGSELREISTALGDEWNVIRFPEAITALKARLATAESRLDTERELREAAERNIESLANYSAAIDGDHVVSGKAVEVRNVIQAMRQGLRISGEEIERLRHAADAERAKAMAIGTLREKVQHLDDDHHWQEFRRNCESLGEITLEFVYRSGFNAAANAVIVMPELNPNPAEP